MDLNRYRPADATVAAVQMAIANAEADAPSIESRAAEAKANRDALLLDGGPKELKAAEDALHLARGEAERLEAIRAQLRTRLEKAREDEVLGLFTAAEIELSTANVALTGFWRERGAELVQLLERGWTLHGQREAARYRLKRAQSEIIREFPQIASAVVVPKGVTGLAPEAEPFVEMYDFAGPWLLGQPQPEPLPPQGLRGKNPIASFLGRAG